MNPDDALNAVLPERHKVETGVGLDAVNVRCIRLFVLPAEKKQPFLFNRLVTNLCTAEIVTKHVITGIAGNKLFKDLSKMERSFYTINRIKEL